MSKEIPPYQVIDILLGADKRDISPPEKGWYISIPDQEGRNKMPDRFVLDEHVLDERVEFAKSVSKYPHAVCAHRCWVHKESGRQYRTPR